MKYVQDSERLTGYKVRAFRKKAFTVIGYTLLVPPKSASSLIPQYWRDITADGRLEQLKAAAPDLSWVLGLGSWDPECEKEGSRYTICVEQTEQTDLSRLEPELFTKNFGASEWLCFELTFRQFQDRFWQDDPYKMLKTLGYSFHTREGDYSVGLHIEAYPHEFAPGEGTDDMEFWITVTGA